MSNIMIVPVPLFNKTMSVEAYRLDYQKENELLNSIHSTTMFDGAAISPALEILNAAGIEAFTIEQPVFVPVSSIMLLGDLAAQCTQSPNKVVFLFTSDLKPEEPYLCKLKELKKKGFRIAFYDLYDLQNSAPIFHLGDYIFLNVEQLGEAVFTRYVDAIGLAFRNLSIIATEINTFESFRSSHITGVSLFEGPFYRLPITAGQSEVSPLKANLIRLLNIVRDENFEFNVVSDIVQRDTALTISLMRLINSPYIGLSQKVKTINHAVTILGQDEVRKWVTMSVSRLLGTDKPNEVTKLSLIRAKYAENLAPLFNMKQDSQGLFLMGLFSVLDIILEVSMQKAFESVKVSDEIFECLVEGTGSYFKVLDFMRRYEAADWPSVSHAMVLYDISLEDVYRAYIDAISWYSDLILDEVRPNRKSEQLQEDPL